VAFDEKYLLQFERKSQELKLPSVARSSYHADMNEPSVRGRVRLWLQSERAMGVRFVSSAPERSPAPPPTPPAAAIAAPMREQPAAVTKLFVEEPAAISVSFDGPVHSAEEKRSLLAAMDEKEVAVCDKCRLCEGRKHTVFGEGDADAKIVFIGEGPGETEDQTGRPFVGRAGQLLDKMIGAMGLKRQQVFICNIVKCRPPDNRVPAPDEVEACTPYLVRQIEIIRPKVIVTLGLPSTKYMLGINSSMGKLRGHWHQWRGIRLMPTYHPAYLLRQYTDENRAAIWSDLKQVMGEVGLKPRAAKASD
jgi:uracil-DNA glycosylase